MDSVLIEQLLSQVDSDSLQQKLKDAFHEHTVVLSRQLVELQKAHLDLKDRLLDKNAQYDKAVREVRFYRAKYQKVSINNSKRYSYDDDDESVDPQLRFGNPPSMTSLSSVSDDENTAYSLRSFSSRPSCNSSVSGRSQFESCVEDPLDLEAILVMSEEQKVHAEPKEDDDKADKKPCIVTDTILPSPPEHPPPPPPPPLLPTKEKHWQELSPEAAARRTEGLTYACNEGFWNTIARGKSHKEEVDQLVSAYLRRGGRPNVAKNSPSLKSVKEGYGLIHAVVAIKNSKSISRILEAGANPNAIALGPKKEDCTVPLVLASQAGYLRGVRLLIEHGNADLFQRGPQQITALHAAVMSDSMETVLYLLQVSCRALLDSVDMDGATPLHYACGYGRTRMVSFFIMDCRANPDIQNHKGETPLHYAVKRRQYKTVCRLVGDLGAYPNPYVAKKTHTPLDLARSYGFKAIADYLRKMGAKTSKEMEKTAATRRTSWLSRDLPSSAHSNTSSATEPTTRSTICSASIASGETSSTFSSSGSSVASFLGRRTSKASFRSFF